MPGAPIAREIAKALKMNYVFAREFHHLTQGSAASPAFRGQATLSPWPLLNSRIIRFERQSHFWNPTGSYHLYLESRANDDLRCSQLRETLEDLGRYQFEVPIVLAGDLNLEVTRSTHFKITTRQPRPRIPFSSAKESSTGSSPEDESAPSIRKFTAPCPTPTISPPRWSSPSRNQ